MKPKQKPYNDDSAIPSQPVLILRSKLETPAEIHKRTGLNLDRLCAKLIEWHSKELIIGAKLVFGHCSIPVFRLKAIWDE